MTTPEAISSSECHCVFVQTNLDTNLAVILDKDDSLSKFKKKLCTEHRRSFPDIGKINILALKVKLHDKFFYLSTSIKIVSKTFEKMRENWFLYVDVVQVEKKRKRKLSSKDHINETDNVASHPANHMDGNSGLMITSSETTQKKNSNDVVIPILVEAKENGTVSGDINALVVEKEIDDAEHNLRVVADSESGEKLGDDGDTLVVDARQQTANEMEQIEMEKFTDENRRSIEHEVAKDSEEEAGEPKENTLISYDAPNLVEIGKEATKSSYEKETLNIVETPLVNNNNASITPAKSDSESIASSSRLKKSILVVAKADTGNNFGSSQKKNTSHVGNGVKKQGQVSSKNQQESRVKKTIVKPFSTHLNYLQSRAKKALFNNNNNNNNKKKKIEETVKKSSNLQVKVKKPGLMNFFENVNSDSEEDESEKLPLCATNTSSSDSCSSDDGSDSDEGSVGRVVLGTKRKCSGSLKDILRNSKSYKEARERASQYVDTSSDNDDETPALTSDQKK